MSSAALLAHVAIDVAGDYLLVHDTYDGIEHRSRSDIFALASSLVLGAAVLIVTRALRLARGGGMRDARAEFLTLVGSSAWRFIVHVMVLSIVTLIAMEAADVYWGGKTIDDAADLFGGSLPLGLSLTLPISAACALAVRQLARIAIITQHSLTAVLGRLIALITRCATTKTPRRQRRDAGVRRYRSILARRCGKRGPPPHVERTITAAS